MLEIIDLRKFNYEDLEEIVTGAPSHLEFIGNASRYIHLHVCYTLRTRYALRLGHCGYCLFYTSF